MTEKYLLLKDICRFYRLSQETVEKELGIAQNYDLSDLVPSQTDIVKQILNSSGKVGLKQGARLAMLSVGLTALGSKDTASSPIGQWTKTEIRKSIAQTIDRISIQQLCTLMIRKDLRQCAFCKRIFSSSKQSVNHLLKDHVDPSNYETKEKWDRPDGFLCNQCGFNAPSELALDAHYKVVHRLDPSQRFKNRDREAVQHRIDMLHRDHQRINDYFQQERETVRESSGTTVSWPSEREVLSMQSHTDARGLAFEKPKKRVTLPEPEITMYDDSSQGSI